ncbi:Alternaria alternata allergen 1 [Microdochium nivale]|nr:Alternaria alternata allergen 1 [Microdochium nivale]
MHTSTLLFSVAAVALPAVLAAPTAPAAIMTRRDDNPGCSATSFHNLAWDLGEFAYNASYLFTNPAHQNSWGIASFELSNPALTYKATCTAASSQLSEFFYGTVTYNCEVPTPEGDGTTTTFTFDYPGRKLAVKQTWTCSDEDPMYPTTFRASGTIDLALDCTDTGYVVNPDWENGSGEFYSTRYVGCAPLSLKGVKPTEITATA